MTGTLGFRFGHGRLVLLLVLVITASASLIGVFALSDRNSQAKADTVPGVSIVVSPTEVNFDRRSSVRIYGSGLTPGTEVGILVLDSFGVYSDISYVSTPFPSTVNDDGAFAINWVLDRWTREGVGTEGLFTVQVVDRDFNPLGTAPLALCNYARGEGAKVPDFCSK